MKLKCFSKPRFLEEIGRPLLEKFVHEFEAELAAKRIHLPNRSATDEEYFRELSALAISPDKLPSEMLEAMFVIEESATEEGQERIEAAVARGDIKATFQSDSSHADIALQAWLVAPQGLADVHNELRLSRLSAFEYFGSKSALDLSTTFVPPAKTILAHIAEDVDAWCAKHNRGEETAQIKPISIDDETWFLVRHGDTFSRTPKVEKRTSEIMHFRPAKDDVVVYSPSRDEIRIHAGTKGEKELYRKAFGRHIFDDEQYFSERKSYTLDPLRKAAEDALNTDGVNGLSQVVLREIEVAFHNAYDEVIIRKATDLFAAATASSHKRSAIPSGRLVRATFDIYFGDPAKPRKVQLRPPNILKLGRHCDASVVQRWLSLREFRVVTADKKS